MPSCGTQVEQLFRFGRTVCNNADLRIHNRYLGLLDGVVAAVEDRFNCRNVRCNQPGAAITGKTELWEQLSGVLNDRLHDRRRPLKVNAPYAPELDSRVC